jgi:sterol 24-C-methyltransferase
LACRLGINDTQRVLDVGCGVGGPARNIARLTGADITGITICDYQVARANAKAKAAGPGLHGGPLSDKLHFVKADFMKLDQSEALQQEIKSKGLFDAAYAIEATCHAPDRVKCYSEVFSTLKPGAVFGGYEWVSTDKYDPSNPEHKRIMEMIEVGNGLPTIKPASDVENALKAAGFEVEVIADLAPTSPMPWYSPFLDMTSMKGFGASKVGIFLTSVFINTLETLRLAPSGTSQMHFNLTLGARGLTEAGKRGIFTVMLLFVARKPVTSK